NLVSPPLRWGQNETGAPLSLRARDEGVMAPVQDESRRALVLHELPLVVDLIELTLNHSLFAVKAARSLAEAERLLADWHPHMAVLDMDHADSAGLLRRLAASGSLTG